MTKFKNDIEEFRDILSRLKSDKECVKDFKDVNLRVFNSDHPLNGILEPVKCTAPFVMATMPYECLETPKGAVTDQSLSSVEGSPMELQEFHIPSAIAGSMTDAPEQLICPLKSDKARMLISLYNLCTQNCDSKDPPLPLVVICDGTDPEGLLVTAVEAKPSGNKGITWDLHFYQATMEGCQSANSTMPSPQAIMKKFDFGNVKRVESHCRAMYEIFGTMSNDATLPSRQGSLKIQVEWRKLTTPFQTMDAVATVKAEPAPGDIHSAAYALYTELYTLKGFLRGLHDGVVQWSVYIDKVPVVQRIKLYIEDLELEMAGRPPPDRTNKEGVPVEQLILVIREDLDFTDKLWDILKDCQSREELLESLQYVLVKLQQGSIQPMVHKRNRSQLAGLVRQSYTGSVETVQLTDVLALRLLAEIGVEKLLQCHTFHLIRKEWVTKAHLEYYFSSECPLEQQAMRLGKLHYALELAIMLEQVLQLPIHALSLATRMALKYYEDHSTEEQHSFSIPVQMSSVANILQTLHPCEWKAMLTAARYGQEEHGVYMLTTHPPFHHTQTSKCEDKDRSVLGDDLVYYQTCVTHSVVSL